MSWGVSHLSNLAYCYGQQHDERQKQLLDLLLAQFERYDLGDFNLPGFALVQAKCFLLSDEPEQAEQSLQSPSLAQCKLRWLIERDPVFAGSRR
jgi:hypothetical protein